MVEDRVADGERIAELLASELVAGEQGPLDRVTIVDADRTATPSAEGTVAYRIAHAEERVGSVELFPDRTRVSLSSRVPTGDAAGPPPERRTHADLTVERDGADTTLLVRSGAAVKAARDAIAAALGADEVT